ncbi:hypothetical protein H1C71_028446 [Ictidomys tridecemlineatus]|nr:hypothetical protein H1C71_028446 [Ictidomys tridecemlineatus]
MLQRASTMSAKPFRGGWEPGSCLGGGPSWRWTLSEKGTKYRREGRGLLTCWRRLAVAVPEGGGPRCDCMREDTIRDFGLRTDLPHPSAAALESSRSPWARQEVMVLLQARGHGDGPERRQCGSETWSGSNSAWKVGFCVS